MQKTFVFLPRNDRISNEEDKHFLLNMMGPKTASFGSADKIFAATSKKISQRKVDEEKQQLKEQRRLTDYVIMQSYAGSDSS